MRLRRLAVEPLEQRWMLDGLSITPLTDPVTTEAGGQTQLEVRLTFQPDPLDTVMVAVLSLSVGEGTVQPAEMSFGHDDWDEPQVVTVTGVDDGIDDGDIPYRIVAAGSYEEQGLIDELWLTNLDDDSLDFGDAPASYATLLVDGPARHLAIGPTLGAVRDLDKDGQPTAEAHGDDTDGIDDEDGVSFGSTIRAGQLDAAVTVNVRNAPGGAKLDAWIDFNGDGAWDGPDEQIADRVAVSQGDNVLQFDVPGWTTSGETYARFRLSTAGNLAPAGRASDGEVEDHLLTVEPPPAEIIARHIFYNNSSFDDGNPLPSADDQAVAPDKAALLPGQTATLANYTSYSRGINGIMIDVAGLTGVPTADDFVLTVGNTVDPTAWVDAPAPESITIRPGQGVDGSDRVTLVWPDNAIQKQWLQVTIPAGGNLGLAEPDLFYFGNAMADSGNATTNAKVDVFDILGTRNNQRNFTDPAPIDFDFDYDRNRRVDIFDMLIARNNQTQFHNALKLITVPDGKAAEAASAVPAVVDWLYALEATCAEPAAKSELDGERDATAFWAMYA